MNVREILWEASRIRRELMDRHPEYAATLALIRFQASNRMTASAGIAYHQSKRIKLSVPYFSSPANAVGLRRTVVHEIAHILAPPHEMHGPTWRAIDIALGGDGTRCHTMRELGVGFKKRERKERTPVPCSKCGLPIRLGPTQLRRARQGYTYSHKKCPGRVY